MLLAILSGGTFRASAARGVEGKPVRMDLSMDTPSLHDLHISFMQLPRENFTILMLSLCELKKYEIT